MYLKFYAGMNSGFILFWSIYPLPEFSILIKKSIGLFNFEYWILFLKSLIKNSAILDNYFFRKAIPSWSKLILALLKNLNPFHSPRALIIKLSRGLGQNLKLRSIDCEKCYPHEHGGLGFTTSTLYQHPTFYMRFRPYSSVIKSFL